MCLLLVATFPLLAICVYNLPVFQLTSLILGTSLWLLLFILHPETIHCLHIWSKQSFQFISICIFMLDSGDVIFKKTYQRDICYYLYSQCALIIKPTKSDLFNKTQIFVLQQHTLYKQYNVLNVERIFSNPPSFVLKSLNVL